MNEIAPKIENKGNEAEVLNVLMYMDRITIYVVTKEL